MMQTDIYLLTCQMEKDHWWYVGRRKIILSLMETMVVNRLSEEDRPRILDYGCGTGLMLKYLSDYGRTWGADSSSEAVKFCKKRGLTNVIDLSIEPLDFPPNFFDIITLFDVLEHLDDERSVLVELHGLLKPGGFLFVTVPAYEFLWSGEDFVSGHKRRYTRKSLRRVIEPRFRIGKLSYFNCLLFPAQVAVILWKRLFVSRSLYETNVEPMNALINQWLSWILSFESNWLVHFDLPFGGSILCIASPT